MNLILLFAEDFLSEHHVRLDGRRFDHIQRVHRAGEGQTLVAGRAGGRIGSATITQLTANSIEMDVHFDRDPPPPLPVTLVLALPRPKVLNRLIAAATSMGIKRIILINAWKVEKSYWRSPRLSEENLRQQCVVGLEQAVDTILPIVETRRFFRRFVEDELPAMAANTVALVAHPGAASVMPEMVTRPVSLVIGPEGGFVPAEIASLEQIGFQPASLGPRILRVETAVAAIVGRLGLSLTGVESDFP